MAFSSLANHATYSRRVQLKPAGTGEPKPGGDNKTTSVMRRSCSNSTTGDQMSDDSGFPCTNTFVIAMNSLLIL